MDYWGGGGGKGYVGPPSQIIGYVRTIGANFRPKVMLSTTAVVAWKSKRVY